MEIITVGKRHVNKFAETIERISLFGSQIEYISNPFEGDMVILHSKTIDSEDEESPFWKQSTLRLMPGHGLTDQKIIDRIHSMAIQSAAHEVNEFFKVDGVAIFNPHKVKS